MKFGQDNLLNVLILALLMIALQQNAPVVQTLLLLCIEIEHWC